MKSSMRWMAVVLVAAVIWGLSARLNHAQSSGTAGNGTKVAVVDLFRVFNSCDQTNVLNELMQEHQAAVEQEAKQRLAAIQAEEETLKVVASDSADWFKQAQKVKKMRLEFKIWGALERDNIDENYLRWVKKTYAMVSDEIAATAKGRGFDLVVTRDEVDTKMDSRLGADEQKKLLLQQILNRKVVYSDDAIDLTDEVLANLNAAFTKAGGAASIRFTR